LVENAKEARIEALKGFKFSEKKFKSKKDIDRKTVKYIGTYAEVIAKQQAADIEKAVTFKFGNMSDINDHAVIEGSLKETAGKTIEKSTKASGTIGAAAINKSRFDTFFDKEMKEEIESFTYMNNDPVSSICQYLNGKTVSINDRAALTEYSPPLHHNCKTYLSVNFRDEKNADAEKIAPSSEQLKSKTLGESI